MNKNMIIGVSAAVIVLIVVIGAVLLTPKATTTTNPTPTPTDTANLGTIPPVSSPTEFTVQGGNYFFNPNQIKVKKGSTVKITFQNSGGMHDFVIDEFKVRTNVIKSGDSANVEFVADKTGSFEYYCSVSQHRQLGMKGTLIVE